MRFFFNPHYKDNNQKSNKRYSRLNKKSGGIYMNQIMELREKRNKAWEAAKGFLDSKQSEDGIVSAEDTATYEKMEMEVVSLGNEIKRLERQCKLDAELSKPTSNYAFNKPNQTHARQNRASDNYKKAFWNMMRGKLNSEVQNTLTIGTDTQGGYLVPDEFENTLLQALEEENVFRRIASVIKTSSGDMRIPMIAAHGTASWADEGAAITESDEAFSKIYIGAHKLATMLKVSEELLGDSGFDIPKYIAGEFARRIGKAEEAAFISGDGNSKPSGILIETGGAEIGVTAASATTITADEIIDLYYSLRLPYRKNAVFIMNDATVKAIRKLKDGSGEYIWHPSLAAGQPDTILGRPVETTEFMPQIASASKVIAFGDFSYYWVADRQAKSFQRLNELFARNGQVGFKAFERVDGKLMLPEAIKVLKMKQ